jgi:hypothetical protein
MDKTVYNPVDMLGETLVRASTYCIKGIAHDKIGWSPWEAHELVKLHLLLRARGNSNIGKAWSTARQKINSSIQSNSVRTKRTNPRFVKNLSAQ